MANWRYRMVVTDAGKSGALGFMAGIGAAGVLTIGRGDGTYSGMDLAGLVLAQDDGRTDLADLQTYLDALYP